LLAPRSQPGGRGIKRVVVAFEAGRDGFWLARWLRARDVEAYVIHPTSIAVSREHRRAKTDRLDTELLMRVFLGWLRGEKRHCSMVAIPTIEEEDARRPNRERQNLVTEQTRIINQIKAIFTRFGLRILRPTMRKLAEGLEDLRTAQGTPSPQNTLTMRMTASWCDPHRINRIQGCGATSAPRMASSPRISRADLQAQDLLMSVKGKPSTGNPQCAPHSTSRRQL
jgi:transposase